MVTQVRVPYTYLSTQFQEDSALFRDIMGDIELVIFEGDFTLGKRLIAFEEQMSEYIGVKHAIGVASGTDALFLILKALGIGPGDAVVTVPNTFIATVGAIIACGANFSFVDIDDRFLMPFLTTTVDVVLPVHWAGDLHPWPSRVNPVQNGLRPPAVVEDACQAIGSWYQDQDGTRHMAGSFGIAAAFSLHPLKNVNIWGDGGVVTTNDDGLAQELRLLRNHGLEGRDTWVKAGYNSRLDTIQAVVASHGLRRVEEITQRRIENARRYDEGLRTIPEITVPPREPTVRHVYHLYQVLAQDRNGLLTHLQAAGIEAKVHYPVPLHLQPALSGSGFHSGDYPEAERFASSHITLPIHQHLVPSQIDYTIERIHEFYRTHPS